MRIWLAVAVVMLLAGCQGSPAYYHRDVQRHVVVLDKREVSVLPLGKDLWEAYGGKQGGSDQAALDKQKARQVKAIETVSGCTVINALYPEEAQKDKLLLRATVDCTRKPAL
jgi:hypothetical protein